jgi:hypothetical protein
MDDFKDDAHIECFRALYDGARWVKYSGRIIEVCNLIVPFGIISFFGWIVFDMPVFRLIGLVSLFLIGALNLSVIMIISHKQKHIADLWSKLGKVESQWKLVKNKLVIESAGEELAETELLAHS